MVANEFIQISIKGVHLRTKLCAVNHMDLRRVDVLQEFGAHS